MTLERIKLGKRGEREAKKHLKAMGLKVIVENYRCKYGEIDLIAKDGDILVFVEVKTRTSKAFGAPEEAVHARKRERIIKASLDFVATRWKGSGSYNNEPQMRFDVVSILDNGVKAGGLEVNIIKDAFSADGY